MVAWAGGAAAWAATWAGRAVATVVVAEVEGCPAAVAMKLKLTPSSSAGIGLSLAKILLIYRTDFIFVPIFWYFTVES